MVDFQATNNVPNASLQAANFKMSLKNVSVCIILVFQLISKETKNLSLARKLRIWKLDVFYYLYEVSKL